MKNGAFFRATCVAMAVLLHWGPLFDLATHTAQAQSVLHQGIVTDDISDSSAQAASPYGVVPEFWQLFWNLDFVPDESGMMLGEEVGVDLWEVDLLSPGEPAPIATGLYHEFGRVSSGFEVDATQEDLLDHGVLAVEFSVSSGVFSGPDGFEAPIVAMVTQYIFIPGFAPVDHLQTITPAAIVEDAQSAWELMYILSGLHDIGPDTYVGDLDAPLSVPAGGTPFGPRGVETSADETPPQEAAARNGCPECYTPCEDCGPPPSDPCDDFFGAIQPCGHFLADVVIGIGVIWGLCKGCQSLIWNQPLWEACVAACGVAAVAIALKALIDFLMCVLNIWHFLRDVCSYATPNNNYPPFTPPDGGGG